MMKQAIVNNNMGRASNPPRTIVMGCIVRREITPAIKLIKPTTIAILTIVLIFTLPFSFYGPIIYIKPLKVKDFFSLCHCGASYQ